MQVRMVGMKKLAWWQKLGVFVALLAFSAIALLFFAVFLGLLAAALVFSSLWVLWRRWRLRYTQHSYQDGMLRAEYREIRRGEERFPRRNDSASE